MKRTLQVGCLAAQPTSLFPAGQVLEIRFATFTPRITIALNAS